MNKTLIIFHLVDDCHSFHRMPMIKAFAKSAINDFDILCVCPAISVGSVFNGRIFNAESVGRISKIDKNLFCYTPIIHEDNHHNIQKCTETCQQPQRFPLAQVCISN